MDSPFNPYDEIAYPSYPISSTHPDRLATIATLFGMKPPPVEQCRVLELGCSDGANLLAMAVSLPHSEFVGVDSAGTAIVRGCALIAELGLKNISLRHLNLLEMAPEYGRFDYIIAHGLYTWVPEAVRDQILALCRGSLTPHGVAFVSYNTFPGCYSRVMIRDLMLFHSRDICDPQKKLEQSLSLLNVLGNAVVEPATYTRLLQEEFGRVVKRAKEVFYHDELAEVFAPVYFHQFMEHAGRQELQFLGEVDYFDMCPGGLSAPALEVLNKIDDLILKEQYLDFMRGRAFRKTLLCHANVPLDRSLKPQGVKSLYVSSTAQPDAVAPTFDAAAQETFRGDRDAKLTTADPLARALFWYLIEVQPQRIPFARLAAEVESRARRQWGFVPELSQDIPGDLAEFVWLMYSAGLLGLHVHVPFLVGRASDWPLASPLARRQARDSNVVSTLHHRSLKLGDSIQRGLVPLLDGTRDRTALLRDLKTLFETGSLTFVAEDGKPLADPGSVAKKIDDGLEELLHQIARMGLLMA